MMGSIRIPNLAKSAATGSVTGPGRAERVATPDFAHGRTLAAALWLTRALLSMDGARPRPHPGTVEVGLTEPLSL